MSDFYIALADQEGKVNMRLDVVTAMVLSYCFLDRFFETFFINLLYSHLRCYQFLTFLLTMFRDFKTRQRERNKHTIH